MDRATVQKIEDYHEQHINQPTLRDIYRTVLSTTTEYTFFQSVPGIFSRLDHTLGHKEVPINLKVFKSYIVYSLTTMK